MKNVTILTLVAALVVPAISDSFGTGNDAFTIDFVTISGGTNPDSGYGIVNNDYRMGTYEITNDQWNNFNAAYGAVEGSEQYAYDYDPYWTGTNVPTNDVSWYEAAQFVNFLNTSKGYQAAYKFTGTIHTSSYTLGVWGSESDGTNLYRNKNAKYFLPTENEWVKAAYWNGTNLQTWATIGNVYPTQGNGSNGGWNYRDDDDGPEDPIGCPWAVGIGSQELNGTYDMMGNVWEWMENPYNNDNYSSGSTRSIRGGSYFDFGFNALSSFRYNLNPYHQNLTVGFRVASIPEPCTLLLLGFGGVMIRRR